MTRERKNGPSETAQRKLYFCQICVGCMSDEAFVKVLDEFSGDFLWGTAAKK
jgi:hypothetical protein